jgi:hypothetical protein
MRVARRLAELSEERVQELADYFDRTDTSELPWDEATDIAIERPELEQISLGLPKDDLASLKRRASRLGVSHATLVCTIVREYLNSPLTR